MPLIFDFAKRYRTSNAKVPKCYKTGSAEVPKCYRTDSAKVPKYYRTLIEWDRQMEVKEILKFLWKRSKYFGWNLKPQKLVTLMSAKVLKKLTCPSFCSSLRGKDQKRFWIYPWKNFFSSMKVLVWMLSIRLKAERSAMYGKKFTNQYLRFVNVLEFEFTSQLDQCLRKDVMCILNK